MGRRIAVIIVVLIISASCLSIFFLSCGAADLRALVEDRVLGQDDGRDGDTIPPTVVSTSPAEDEGGISRMPEIRITFSEPMNPSSINENTILLEDPPEIVASSVTYDADSNTAILVPDNKLALLYHHPVTVTDDVADEAGNTMAEEFLFHFTVRDGVWGTQERISPIASCAQSELACDLGGNVTAVWQQDGTGIGTNRLGNDGAWGTPTSIPRTGNGPPQMPQISVNQEGNKCLVWWDERTITMSDRTVIDSITWSTETAWALSDQTAFLSPNDWASIDPNNLTIGYFNNRSDGHEAIAVFHNQDGPDIYWNWFSHADGWHLDGGYPVGTNLSNSAIVKDNGFSLDVNQYIFTAFTAWAETDQRIWTAYYNGSAFEAPQDRTGMQADTMSRPKIRMNSSNEAVLAWVGQVDTSTSHYINADIFNGTSWEGFGTISGTFTQMSGIPFMEADICDAGSAIVVWVHNSDRIYANRFNGSDWESATGEQIDDGALGISTKPQIAMDPQGNAVAVWVQNSNCYANRYRIDSGWGSPEKIESLAIGVVDPRIVIDTMGNVTVIWTADTPDGTYAVRFE